MTTDLTMLKASLEASQAALQAASYALHSVQAAVSALLLQSQPQDAFPAVMQDTHTETDAPPAVPPASIAAPEPPVVVADELQLEPEDLDPMLAPLTPEERKGINAQLGQLEAAQLKAFTAAFRKAFDVPAEVRMIKGEITQQRHGAWILSYLEGQADGSDQ
jgi:hypothetical protein